MARRGAGAGPARAARTVRTRQASCPTTGPAAPHTHGCFPQQHLWGRNAAGRLLLLLVLVLLVLLVLLLLLLLVLVLLLLLLLLLLLQVVVLVVGAVVAAVVVVLGAPRVGRGRLRRVRGPRRSGRALVLGAVPLADGGGALPAVSLHLPVVQVRRRFAHRRRRQLARRGADALLPGRLRLGVERLRERRTPAFAFAGRPRHARVRHVWARNAAWYGLVWLCCVFYSYWLLSLLLIIF